MTQMIYKPNRLRENRFVVTKGEGDRGGMEWEFRISRCKLLYIEWINKMVLLYSKGNYIQCPVIGNYPALQWLGFHASAAGAQV